MLEQILKMSLTFLQHLHMISSGSYSSYNNPSIKILNDKINIGTLAIAFIASVTKIYLFTEFITMFFCVFNIYYRFYFFNRKFIFYINLIRGSFTLFAVSWSAYKSQVKLSGNHKFSLHFWSYTTWFKSSKIYLIEETCATKTLQVGIRTRGWNATFFYENKPI